MVTSGWIAFVVLLAFIGGMATAMILGQWVVKRQKEQKKEKYGER